MVRSVQASLDYASRTFGPYPHAAIRIVERPREGYSVHGAPTIIAYDEVFPLLNAKADSQGVDAPFAMMAYEVAHQWWGDQLSPANVEGSAFVTEALAWYSMLGTMQQAYGAGHVERYISERAEDYLGPRWRAHRPLLRAGGYDVDRRAPFTMYAMREYVGAEKLDAALRRLYEKYSAATPPLPTSLDVYRELQAATPDSLRYLLVDLFEQNTWWDLKTKSVSVEPAGAGQWRVTLDVEAHKVVVDANENEKEVPMNDLAEVGIFGSGAQQRYLRMHRIRSGEQRIVVMLPWRPDAGGIDPRRLLIDGNGGDNSKAVQQTDGR
jgi:ABC-2 type transport system permease protein